MIPDDVNSPQIQPTTVVEGEVQSKNNESTSETPSSITNNRLNKVFVAVMLGILTLLLQLLGFVYPEMQVVVWPIAIACGTLGIWLFGVTQFNYASRLDVALARQDGPGDSGSEERDRWTRVQRQRANWIATILVFVTILALSLFIGNHLVVRPSANNAITEPPYQPYWQMYEDKEDTYITEPGDVLASAAFALGSSVSLLAQTNPTIVISLTQPTTSALPVNGSNTATLEEIARRLQKPLEEIAPIYSTNPVLPDQIVSLPSSMPRHWFDWMLWCVIGIAAYLLINLSSAVKGIANGKIDFLENTLWYWAQFITGPMIAFVLLLFLTRVNFEIVGTNGEAAIAIDLGQLPPNLLFIFAFILGYFGRLARKLLEQIAKSIFRDSWMAAYGDFRITIKDRPYDHILESGERVVFATDPNVGSIKWTTEDDVGGFKTDIYRAPDAIEKPIYVTVTATPTDGGGGSVSQQFLVVPEKFQVRVDGSNTMRTGETRTLRIESNLGEVVTSSVVQPRWSLVNGSDDTSAELSPQVGFSTVLTLKKTPKHRRIAVNATYRGYSIVTYLKISDKNDSQETQ